MAGTLHKDKWWILSPHVGETPRVVPTNPVPSFIALWQKIALTVDPERYEAELGPKYKRMLELAVKTDYTLEGSTGPDHSQPGVSRYWQPYFGANLGIIQLTALAMLQNEADPDRAATAAVHTALLEYVTAGYDHLSASFPSHFLAVSSEAVRNSAAGKKQADMLQATLLDFATVSKWDRHGDLRNETKLEPHCAIKGLRCEPVPNGAAACDEKCMAVHAFPASERVPTDCKIVMLSRCVALSVWLTRKASHFTDQWQRSPTSLVSGQADTAHEFSAIDLMLPYWMGRAAGAIPAPAGEREHATPEPPPGSSVATDGLSGTMVFSNGLGGVANYRIPSVVQTGDGSLVAFAEARDGGDSSASRIATRVSTDGTPQPRAFSDAPALTPVLPACSASWQDVVGGGVRGGVAQLVRVAHSLRQG